MHAESTAVTSAVTSYSGLEDYLSRLHDDAHAHTRIRADTEGRVRGRYFNSTLTSAFQAIRKSDALGLRVVLKRVDNIQTMDTLKSIAARSAHLLHAQGYLWKLPQAALRAQATMSARSLHSIAT